MAAWLIRACLRSYGVAWSSTSGIISAPLTWVRGNVSGDVFQRKSNGSSDDVGTVGKTWVTRPEHLTAAAHRRAGTGGAEREWSLLCTAAPPPPPFAAYARSLFEVSRGGSGSAAAGPNA